MPKKHNANRNKSSYSLVWSFFLWSRTLFPGEQLPHQDDPQPYDLILTELHHVRTHIVYLVEGLMDDFYTNPLNAVRNQISDVANVEVLVREKVSDEDLQRLYMEWLKKTKDFLNGFLQTISEAKTLN